MSRSVRVFPSPEALRVASGLAVLGVMEDAVRGRGAAFVALAGGSTPAGTYGWLADRTLFPWEKVHFFWGDERCVPPDHPESNFRMVRGVLLDKLSAPGPRVHPIQAARPPDEAAAEYEQLLREVVPAGADGVPALDLVILGLGEDGHTASLFPGTAVLEERSRLVLPGVAPVEPSARVTLTFAAVNAARRVLFLVSGERKARIVRDVLEGPTGLYPAQRVSPAGGAHWYLDAAAAAELSERKGA